MAYLCSQRRSKVHIYIFMFDRSIYRLFVLNRGWKRYSLQIMILVYVCSTCSVVELKTRLEPWKARNDVNGVKLFHLSYFITLIGLPVLTLDTKCPNQVFYDWLLLNSGWNCDSLQIMVFVYVCSTWIIVELKTRFETWIT
jgi:hypothetical protein